MPILKSPEMRRRGRMGAEARPGVPVFGTGEEPGVRPGAPGFGVGMPPVGRPGGIEPKERQLRPERGITRPGLSMTERAKVQELEIATTQYTAQSAYRGPAILQQLDRVNVKPLRADEFRKIEDEKRRQEEEYAKMIATKEATERLEEGRAADRMFAEAHNIMRYYVEYANRAGSDLLTDFAYITGARISEVTEPRELIARLVPREVIDRFKTMEIENEGRWLAERGFESREDYMRHLDELGARRQELEKGRWVRRPVAEAPEMIWEREGPDKFSEDMRSDLLPRLPVTTKRMKREVRKRPG